MSDQLLVWLSLYGLPAYFLILAVSSVGIPFPITLMLIVIGSFVEQGEMSLWQVIPVGIAAAVLGDQIGYWIGRYGGKSMLNRLTRRFGGEENIKRAHEFTIRWGGAGIFLSRWLVTPLGPWLNLTSGTTNYPWPRFLLWDILGQTFWVVIYILLGKFFSDRVQEISDIMGNLTWVLVGLLIAGVLGWKLLSYFRSSETGSDSQ